MWSLGSRSAAALHAGDVDLALAAAQEAVDLSADLDEGFHSAEAAVDLARALLETGEPQRAVDLLVGSAGGEELVLIAGGPRAHYLESLTLCWLALDRPTDARRAAVSAEAWASVAAASDGDRLGQSSGGGGRPPCRERLGGGRTGALGGRRALRRSERRSRQRSRARWRDALWRKPASVIEPFRSCSTRRQSSRRAARYGGVTRPNASCASSATASTAEHARGKAGATGLEALTSRELQVARLVVDRKTNPQIAAELFLSQKTVETHLRNIFRKVDVSSRVELARAVERADSNGL